ncbi:uncharacterized protein LOC115374016 [Myripristis murdjan]|uniref:uncharacterized protein LOC115374016 n=1 Tax=Myripristis murdjan TaxID=586833 RepID=UPI00117601A3|nr:uncharacterized protein LOC115374016 [Myripristis murdjan]
MNRVADWLLLNKDKIEKGADLLGQASEALAGSVGKLHPVLETVFVTFAKILKTPKGGEAGHLADTFEVVTQTLVGFQNDMDQIYREQQRTAMNKRNFGKENQILNQYERLEDYANARPQDKQRKKEKFLNYYMEKGGDLNVNALYSDVITDNLLEKIATIEQKNSRAVKYFYARLINLFAKGISTVLSHAALTQSNDREALAMQWRERMVDMENQMKTVLDDCTENVTD